MMIYMYFDIHVLDIDLYDDTYSKALVFYILFKFLSKLNTKVVSHEMIYLTFNLSIKNQTKLQVINNKNLFVGFGPKLYQWYVI